MLYHDLKLMMTPRVRWSYGCEINKPLLFAGGRHPMSVTVAGVKTSASKAPRRSSEREVVASSPISLQFHKAGYSLHLTGSVMTDFLAHPTSGSTKITRLLAHA